MVYNAKSRQERCVINFKFGYLIIFHPRQMLSMLLHFHVVERAEFSSTFIIQRTMRLQFPRHPLSAVEGNRSNSNRIIFHSEK